MKYFDGLDVQIGDNVLIGKVLTGKVVAIIEDKLYAEGYDDKDWNFISRGMIIKSEQLGDILYDKPDEDIELESRHID